MQKLRSYILGLTVFLLPLFFLPVTHEFYSTNKLMLLCLSTLLLLIISVIELLGTRKLEWSRGSGRLLGLFIVFLLCILASTFIRSSNIIQALQNYSFGFLLLSTLTILSWQIAQKSTDLNLGFILRASGFCVAVITIALSFNPFDHLSLPRTFQFLKNHTFSPVGTAIDLIFFLGFITIFQVIQTVQTRKQTRRFDWFAITGTALCVVALWLTVRSMPLVSNNNAPFSLSVQTGLKTFDNPAGLLLGAGINNISTVFTQAKDATYNSSTYWNLNSFDLAFSAILQIVTESGIIGLLTLMIILVLTFRYVLISDNPDKAILTGLLIATTMALFFVPTSVILFFILYVVLGLSFSGEEDKKEINFSTKKSWFLIAPIMIIFLIGISLLVWVNLVPAYRAEIAMRRSVDAVAINNLEELYSQQYQAVVLNPYIERYRLNFSQTNLFLARQLSSGQNANQELLTQAVQQAINQAQVAVALNPRKASNWENLGLVYKNVLGIEGADQWAIAALQRAIILDPQNISYRLELGGIYYSLKQHESAIKTFQEAILLKPDLPNTYYNLAYAYYQNNNQEKALETMDKLLVLLKKQSSNNYNQALKERQNFASGLPQNQAPTVIQ